MGILQDDVVGGIGSVPVCQDCGSERVARDAWACWNPETGLWELETVFDQEWCHRCESKTRFTWKRIGDTVRGATRDLNDRFRRDGLGNGTVVITRGVEAQGPAFIEQAIAAVRAFDSFSDDNDPWGEHDYGAVEVEGEKLFWKIDSYDPTLTMMSENPANEGVTHRVLTIMLAGEY